jgi:hypothetical protein
VIGGSDAAADFSRNTVLDDIALLAMLGVDAGTPEDPEQ